MKIINFGSLNVDYVYQVPSIVRPGETLAAKSLMINPGGKGANQSVALARAGKARLEEFHSRALEDPPGAGGSRCAAARAHTLFVGSPAGNDFIGMHRSLSLGQSLVSTTFVDTI